VTVRSSKFKVLVVGGGPAGLYFSILLKKAQPDLAIEICERNAPGDTFGWGVVFSGRTMEVLSAHDEVSAAAIGRAFATWDNVDVVHRGEKISILGNRFSGIARIELLKILQDRCRELEVDVRYSTEVSNLDDAGDYDLIVGADGVNSLVRRTFESAFEPTVGQGKCSYIWYGTHRIFNGLTLTFHENEHGVFAAHSYKFCADTSTFIVECDLETWRNAGLDRMSEPEGRAYLEQVFRDDLLGHGLLTNASRWLRFPLLHNRRWVSDQVVLMGDAAHTAHFSIGSGTKLALDDAIALAGAFAANSDVTTALTQYETERTAALATYREIARASREWFEQVRSHIHLEPIALAYSTMMRSGRMSREDLRRRDPDFVARYEAFSGG
jgi:anthraniloyl-CoA monooxygenase